jgi:hypothetical protein
MRAWAISVLGILSLSLAAPPVAEARPRLGALLGTVAAPLGIFSTARYSARYVRRGATHSLNDPAAEVFWPDASGDLVQYLIYPRGQGERFWTYDYGNILRAVFSGPVADEARRWRNRKVADGASALPNGAESSASPCDRSAMDADAWIARIDEAIAPTATQRHVLNELRIALAQAGERIDSTCSSAILTPAQRLKAAQDRIWAMRDGLLTLRLPLEKFYASLSGEQYWRLNSEPSDARDNIPKPVQIPTPRCSIIPAPVMTEASMRVIERAVRPGPEQRASFQALRLRSAAMSRLIGDSCPTYPLLGPLDRIAAATDRLDVMLFAVMSMSPLLQQFHDSLDERQKRALGQAVRQFEQPPGSAGGRS